MISYNVFATSIIDNSPSNFSGTFSQTLYNGTALVLNWTDATNTSYASNGTYQYLYVDGILEDSKLKSYNTTNNGNILIGGLTIDTGDFNSFNGSIDEVMIFNKALSENEVKALYNLDLS